MLETLLFYAPILPGFILLILSGFTFPLGGVFILRMNILPIRYLLMHGVLLGGTLGLALGVNPSISSFLVNLLLIVFLSQSSRVLKANYGYLTMFLMVGAIAAASIIMARFNIAPKDTLTLLWGDIYSAGMIHVGSAVLIGGGIVLFSVLGFRHLTAIFYDRDLASSLGINVHIFELVVMLITSLVVASAMPLMGALLLDALLILPVVIAALLASGLKQTMLLSCLFGGLFSIAGFFISWGFDIPLSAGVAIPGVVMFIVVILIKRGRKSEKLV